jgi:hypothetical protein
MAAAFKGFLIGLAFMLPFLILCKVRGWSVSALFAWYDFWIGVYWDRDKRVLYVCPVPMLVFRIDTMTCDNSGHDWVSEGGRSCPKGLSDDCSQAAYRCRRCGDYDYGDDGGPGARDCEAHCREEQGDE